MRKALGLSFILVALSWAGMAQASLVTCEDYGIANNVTNTDGCQIGTTNNNSEAQVNADNMFGHDDWEFLSQPFDDPNWFDDDWSGDAFEGMWDIPASIWTMWEDVMVVFKGGNGGPIDPNNYVGYLVTSMADLISYLSPFTNANGQVNAAAISHIDIYVRGPKSVPEPTTLALLGLGLVGLGFARRRKTG